MRSEGVVAEHASDPDIWRKAFWIVALTGSAGMLYYEYLWSRFVLHNLATISFGWWLWTSLAITTPWTACYVCVQQLREGVRHGTVGRELCPKISVTVELAVGSVYWMLAPEIHRMTSLGALK